MTCYVLEKGHIRRDEIKANAHAFINRLPHTKSWEIEVSEYHPARSDKQRRSLFGVAYKTIMAATGLQGEADKKQLHRDMCCDYFGSTPLPFGGRKPIRTTTRNEQGQKDEISIAEALDMYAFIQRTAAEYGIDVPDPDPFWREKAATERAAA